MTTVDERIVARRRAVEEADRIYAETGYQQQVLHIAMQGGADRFTVCPADEHRIPLNQGEYLLGFVYRSGGQ